MIALMGLFAAAFLAATLVPAQSEAVLVGLLLADGHPVWMLLGVATAGNVLGAVVNWAIGRWIAVWGRHLRSPVSSARLVRAETWYRRWGWISLFGCWLPIVGDPLTVVAGALREPLWRFAIIVTAAKAGRYFALAAVTLALVDPHPA